MLMIPTKQGRAVVDIKHKSKKLGDLCFELMPAHALRGCDQVLMYYGIGKNTMLKKVKERHLSLGISA